MTIDSGWVKILKAGVPNAFTRGAPFRPSVVFIDGQIKLMAPQSIRTWDAFFERQFLNTVETQFDTGASVVVLGFDNYMHVPVAKAPTQRKRNTHVPVVSFDDEDELPRLPPECMAGAMRNRSFKTRVIAFVVRRLRQHFKHDQHRTVVIDYQQEPDVLGRQIALPSVFATDAHRRGECDVKAFAWAELGSLLIVSTDGDFVPLSLLQLDKQPQHPIALLRMATNMGTGVKRSSVGTVRRTYEYVNMHSVQRYLAGEMPDIQHASSLFAVWCMLTGCDFAERLPGLGPTKVWQRRHELQHCATTEAGLLHALCMLYLGLFKNKLGGAVLNEQVRRLSDETASELFACIHQSVQRGLSFAQRTKQRFWTAARARVHVRNVLWTREYWSTQHDYPDPVQDKYGYCRKNTVVSHASE